MSTLMEIENAAQSLRPEDKRKLFLWLAEQLRADGQGLPTPRSFSVEQMRAWIEDDEKDGRELRG